MKIINIKGAHVQIKCFENINWHLHYQPENLSTHSRIRFSGKMKRRMCNEVILRTVMYNPKYFFFGLCVRLYTYNFIYQPF